MEMRKAIPTEYKGVRFDSKSEAVFARTLDLAGHDWVYHPGEHCGHAWDFLVFPTHGQRVVQYTCVCGKGFKSQTPIFQLHYRPVLIEYKPSAPTDTYIRNLTVAMSEQPYESIIVWGSPWKPGGTAVSDCCYTAYPIFSSYAKYGWGDFCRAGDNGEELPMSHRHNIKDMLGITERMAQEAKSYRFDLVQVQPQQKRWPPNRQGLIRDLVEAIPLKVMQLVPEYRSICRFHVFDGIELVHCVWKDDAASQESKEKIDSLISGYGFTCTHSKA